VSSGFAGHIGGETSVDLTHDLAVGEGRSLRYNNAPP
jgi:hypothetical protein